MTSVGKLRLILAAALICCCVHGALATNWQAEGKVFADVLAAARQQNWSGARQLAGRISLPATRTVVEWLQLRDGENDWQRYNDFIARNGDWPGLKILRRSGEAAITANADPERVIAYFRIQPPQTGNGAVRLAEAHSRLGRHNEAAAAIADGWKSLPFSAAEQAEAAALFSREIAPLHLVRLDNLLWERRRKEVDQLLPMLGKGHRALAAARIALQTDKNGVDGLISQIPDELANDPGLSFDRIVWRLNNEAEERALDLWLDVSVSLDTLIRPDRWAKRRLSLAHWLMRERRFDEAYKVASRHFLNEADGPHRLMLVSAAHRDRAERDQQRRFADLVWISGYLSLRFLSDPRSAARHFNTFLHTVDTSISNGRAGYWLGLAYEAAGETSLAKEAFAYGARFQTSFYGQLAAERAMIAADTKLAGPSQVSRPASMHLQRLPVVQAGLLYHYANQSSHAAWFLAHVAETLNESDTKDLAALAFMHGAVFSSVKVAKEGAKRGFSDIEHLFPLVGIEDYSLPVPAEIAMSVARQETEFRDSAVSSRGAVGVMQIKPSTGEELAAKIGLKGNIKSLLHDRWHNVLLGSTYLRNRLDDYGGSFIMAIAAYNAGPGRIASWLPTIGDPRSGQVDPIDWIEHIPFGETRNYVMRVMEAVTIYRMRVSGASRPIRLFRDLEYG